MPTRYDCFKGRVVAVTGGALGIGRSCALMFAEQGARVTVVDIKPEAETDLLENAAGMEGRLRYIQADATKPEEIARVARIIDAEEGPLKVLVNAVGGFPASRPFLELAAEDWEQGIAINLHTVYYSCQEMARLMVRHGGGSIVNIASRAGRIYSAASPAYYASAKAAVEALTRTIAGDLGSYNIRANAVAPGTTMTDRIRRVYTPEQLVERGKSTARGQLAEPEEIAAAVLFLASDDAVHVTGTTLYVTGGQVIVA